MAAFLVSTVVVLEPERFQRYVEGITGLAQQHGGEYLVRGHIRAVLEGETDPNERVVVIRFPSEAALRGYLDSETYLKAKVHRFGAARVTIRLLVDEGG